MSSTSQPPIKPKEAKPAGKARLPNSDEKRRKKPL